MQRIEQQLQLEVNLARPLIILPHQNLSTNLYMLLVQLSLSPSKVQAWAHIIAYRRLLQWCSAMVVNGLLLLLCNQGGSLVMILPVPLSGEDASMMRPRAQQKLLLPGYKRKAKFLIYILLLYHAFNVISYNANIYIYIFLSIKQLCLLLLSWFCRWLKCGFPGQWLTRWPACWWRCDHTHDGTAPSTSAVRFLGRSSTFL